jgi:cytochrome b
MIETKKSIIDRVKTDLLVDSGIFVAFLIAMDPRSSGIAVHEWLGIAFGAAIITHLLLHWRWIVSTTRRLFSRAMRQARLNYFLNTLLFIDITLVIFTGLMISRVALPSLGIYLGGSFIWRGLHNLTANLSLVLIGAHVALHWRWVVETIKRYVFRPFLPKRSAGVSLAREKVRS